MQFELPLVRRLALVALVSVCFGALAYLGITLTRDTGRIAAVWLPNAVLLFAMFKSGKHTWPLLFAGAFAANIAVNLFVGDALPVAAGLAICNTIEVMVALRVLMAFGTERPSFMRFEELWSFVIAALAGAASAAIVASIALHFLSGAEMSDVLWKWLRADVLGLLVITPALVILADAFRQRDRLTRHKLGEAILVIGFGSSVSLYTFWQSSFPLLFLDAPLVLLYAFRLGAVGNAIAILNLALVATVATSLGHGPISLVKGDLQEKLIVLQLFLASSFAMGLPVAALLRAKRAAEDRFHKIAKLSPVGIFSTHSDASIRFGNDVFWSKMEGAGSLLNTPEWKILSEMERGEEIVKDAVGRTLKIRTQKVYNDNGEEEGILGAVIDISAEISAQKKLSEAKRLFENLTEMSPAGIFRTSASGECTYVNRAWERLAGINGFCAMGMGWTKCLHPDDAERVGALWSRAVETSSPFEVEFRFLHEDGTVKWGAALSRPEIRNNGEVVGFIGVCLDITDRKQSEAELVEAKRDADRAAISKSQFLANMSHEIRTPMNGVLGFAEMLSKEDLTHEQHKQVQMIVQSGSTMQQLLNDILDISKMEAGKLELAYEPIDVRNHVEVCVEGLRSLAETKGIALSASIGSMVPHCIKSDPLRFRQIISNIVGNAIKFTEDGHVSVSVNHEAEDGCDRLVVRVSDTGIGIPEDKLEAIFDYFDQGSAGVTNRFGGTGLGLAITKNLIEKFGGSINVQSTQGCGSTFFIRIPFEHCSVHETVVPKAAPIPNEDLVGARDVRILVAEDNEINVRLVRMMLEKLGLEAEYASNGQVAIDMAETARDEGKPFGLVFMDVRMPVMDGLEATRMLRQKGFTKAQLPVFALTANSFAEDVEACLEAGMQGHLAKPLSFDRLLDTLARFDKPSEKKATSTGGQPMPDHLKVQFKAQKDRAIDALGRWVHGEQLVPPSDLETDLHQLAGTAGYFGESDFGENCRTCESIIRTGDYLEAKRRAVEMFGESISAVEA
ncbi:MASE1 domain-containing protein [Croceicoccus gelatinilyticus]|uniref:MASE1 domain-containing protein n=1 Tax=Croceicoccus gelatinilyticus TaxID=2835536 RepID=UPI001BCDEC88|nr:MASE1 domain-containing protein [Croceicoccus gelatinilyticus]MBS7671325.1 MASE1 domain-containing protein [Croceicoccus gelatinilyticus]